MSNDGLDHWIDKVYGANSSEEVLGHYSQWAQDYEHDLMASGYRSMAVAAGMTARHVRNRSARILDAGCGTGLIGIALAALGYDNLHGVDLSAEMLSVAAQKDIYQNLHQLALGAEIDLPAGSFDAIVCSGVLTPGHAPTEALDGLILLTKPKGLLVFSITKTAFDEGFGDKIQQLEKAAAWRPLDRSQPFLPMPYSLKEGDLEATVYVFERV